MQIAADERTRRQADLKELGKLPFRQRNPELLAWLRREVPEWNQRDPDGDANYNYGTFAVDGGFVDNGRKLVTGNAPIGLKVDGHIELDSPQPGSTRDMARRQELRGEFVLTICGVPITVNWGEFTKTVENPMTKELSEMPIVRPIVFENGRKTVSPSLEPDLFAFLELHPDRWDSPYRCAELFQNRLGSPVLVGADFRPGEQARLRRGQVVDIQMQALITDAEDMGQLSMVAGLDDTTLSRIGFDTGFREIVDTRVSRRQQLVAHAGNVLKDKTPQNKLRRDRVLRELSPDSLETEKTTKVAAETGVLVATIVDGLGGYLLNDKLIEGYSYNSESVGREIDALITEMRYRQDFKLIHEIAIAGRQAASSESGKATTFAKHDALMRRIVGEALVVAYSGSGPKQYHWLVSDMSKDSPKDYDVVCSFVDGPGTHKMKKEQQVEMLIKWGRSKGSYENLLSIIEEMVGKKMD